MKRLTVFLLVLVFCFTTMPFCGMAVAEEKAKTYFQYPASQTLKPFSLFNPAITEHKNGKVTKSFFQYPNSKTLPQGSIWNKLISVETKKAK